MAYFFGIFLAASLVTFGGISPAGAMSGLLFSTPAEASRENSTIRPPSKRTVIDPLTGVAMFGFDPISYFTDGQPVRGSRDFEFQWRGATWRFVNAANAVAFSRTPEVYAPVYGGYGVTALSRGYFSDGNPRLYSFYNDRLYLFASFGNREVFLLNTQVLDGRAADGWNQAFASRK